MQKINVIIDARMVDNNLHGIARYTYEIINKLNNNQVNLFLLVNDLKLAQQIFGEKQNIKLIKMRSKFLSLFEQIELPWIINRFNGDVIFHTPSFVCSPFINKPIIMTIHDLNHIALPQYYSKFHVVYYNLIVRTCAKKARKILTVSYFSKNEIVKWLKCKDDKVKVTYNGIDSCFKIVKDENQLQQIREKYNLPEKFILYVGNQKKHKNLLTLFQAMAKLDDKDIRLIINGKPTEETKEVIIKLDLQNKVKFIGYIDDKDLPFLYNCCTLFVFPSLYEGFGLPPLEAMACGANVLVARTSSLIEIIDNENLMFSALDSDELAFKINLNFNSILSNDLINYSLRRVKKFNWDETVKLTLNEYYKILELGELE